MASQPNTLVRLNDYCIVEYWPEQVSLSSNPVFYKIYNKDTGSHHIYNPNDSATMNTQDYSATYVSADTYVYMDQEVSVPYWERYPNKFYTSTPGTYDTFNRVRFHFTSGFDFSSMEALILSIKNKMNNGGYTLFAQLLVTPEWYVDLVKFNPSPIYLADSLFDKYVEVFVPAISQINLDYYNQSPENRSTEFGALATYTGTSFSGFVNNAPVVVSIDEVSRVEEVNVDGEIYNMYITEEHNESVVAVDSLYQRFGLHIGESDVFDAIEFYGTMTNDDGTLSFPEELIDLLSTNAHDDWVIAHQLTIHEWVNGVKSMTGRYMQLQDTDFDSPMYYRPILKSAGSAIAFEIDYTCRLYNRRNGDQIIRVGSYTSYNASKYGRELMTLDLDAMPSSHIVYNKIVKSSIEATDLFVEQNYVTTGGDITQGLQSTPTNVTSFIPMFFNVHAISVSIKDALPDSNEESSTLIYKQGDLRFILNPFDNMFRFKVYTVNNNGKLVPMDLSGFGKFNLVFIDDSKKVKFDYLTDSGTSNPAIGELMFKVPQRDAESILTSSNREVYITLVASDGTETMLYSAFWNKVTEKDEIDANNDAVREEQEEIKRGESSSFFTSTDTSMDATGDEAEKLDTIPSDTKINIPGYVPKVNPAGDVSVVKIITPSGITTTKTSKQSKAESSLSKALGNQGPIRGA